MPSRLTFSPIRTHIAGIAVAELARQFGTPTYVYDAAKITERIADLRQFDVIRYAQKACSNLAILDMVRRQNVLVDSVSAGEIRRALAAGYKPAAEIPNSPPPIVYTADIFDAGALDLVVQHGIHANCGSPDMIDQLGARRPAATLRCALIPALATAIARRPTPAASNRSMAFGTKTSPIAFAGPMPAVWVLAACTCISALAPIWSTCATSVRRSKKPPAISAAPSPISAPAAACPCRIAPNRRMSILRTISNSGIKLRKRLEDAFGHKIWLEIEPGRYLVAESGFLVAEIRAIKRMGKNTFYLLDAGFNNLARPILYGAYHPMSIAPRKGAISAAADMPLQDVVVGGPLCESGDIFTQEEGGFVNTRKLPAAEVGDYLIFEVVGAYGFVMSSNYNSKPMAAEVLIRDGKTHLILRPANVRRHHPRRNHSNVEII